MTIQPVVCIYTLLIEHTANFGQNRASWHTYILVNPTLTAVSAYLRSDIFCKRYCNFRTSKVNAQYIVVTHCMHILLQGGQDGSGAASSSGGATAGGGGGGGGEICSVICGVIFCCVWTCRHPRTGWTEHWRHVEQPGLHEHGIYSLVY